MRVTRQDTAVCALLALVTLGVRLPFFFPAVIDWDESTHVLIGQSLLDGNLPYVELWTLKPPLVFGFSALALTVFGHSLVSVRLAGALCVMVSAVLVYFLTSRCWNRSGGFLAAVVSILVISLIPSGQATMTEIVALPALLGAALLLTGADGSAPRLAAIGVLLAVATLVRLNTAYVVIAVGLLLLARPGTPAERARRVAPYAAGGLIVLAATCLPYAVTGHLELLWRSLVVAPLAYSGSQNTALDNVTLLGRLAFGRASGVEASPINRFLWVAGSSALVLFVWRLPAPSGPERRVVRVVVVMALATALGILAGGAAFAHYLIQLVPFAAVLTAGLLHRLTRPLRYAGWGMTALLAVFSVDPILSEYETMLSRVRNHQDLRHGRAYEVAEFLETENPQKRPVYLLTDHIAYWLADLRPPTALATHPSNIWKTYLVEAISGPGTTSEYELRRVFAQSPEFVIPPVSHDSEAFVTNARASAIFESILAADYEVATRIERLTIYRRQARLPDALRRQGHRIP